MSRRPRTIPANAYAPKYKMATEEFVRRKPRKRRAPAKRTYVSSGAAYKRPTKKAVTRKYPSSKSGLGVKLDIPECSMHYIKSLYNPWSVPAGVCIPCDLFPLPSQKVMVKRRFTVTLSSNGCGFAIFAPATANDLGFVTYSAAGSTGGVSSAFNSGASWTTSNAAFSDLPYSSTDIITNLQIQARIVAFGARARYVGIEDKRGGSYIAFEEQDHQDLYADASNNTIDLVKAYHNAYVTSPRGDGQWDVSVCYSGPVQPQEIDFVNYTAYPLRPSGNITSSSVSPMVLCFAGTSDMAGGLVDVEACLHVEYIGRKVPGKTISHADTATYGKVLEVTKEQAAISTLRPETESTGLAHFVAKVAEAIPKVVKVGSAVVSAATAVATGNPALAIPSIAAIAASAAN